jgi:hypothetical protein
VRAMRGLSIKSVSPLAATGAIVLGVASALAATGAIPARWKNCKAVNSRYPHGMGRFGAHDRTTGVPVRTSSTTTVSTGSRCTTTAASIATLLGGEFA